MRKLSHIQTVISLLLILLLTSFSFGQNNKQAVFAPVPSAVRTQLVERFTKLFGYGRTGQWGHYYDLLYFKKASDSRREYFIEQHRNSSPKGWSWWMVEVNPESARRADGSIPEAEWIIEGSVKVLEQKDGKHSFSVGAVLRDGEWFFSEPSFGSPPFICTPAPRLQPQLR